MNRKLKVLQSDAGQTRRRTNVFWEEGELMDLLNILAKPIQVVKNVLDLDSDLEPPSLVSQFVAVKHQLAEIQERFNEGNRISCEKDVLIAKLQKAMAAKTQPRPTTPAFVRNEETPSQAMPAPQPRQATQVEAREPIAGRTYAPEQARSPQAEPPEELKLPAQASCSVKIRMARPVRARAVAKATASPTKAATTSPTQAAATAKPSAQAGKQATSEKARPTRARVAKKTNSGAKATAKPKESTRARKQAVAGKAKSTRTRATAKKKTAATAKAKTVAKSKRPPRPRKS